MKFFGVYLCDRQRWLSLADSLYSTCYTTLAKKETRTQILLFQQNKKKEKKSKTYCRAIK